MFTTVASRTTINFATQRVARIHQRLLWCGFCGVAFCWVVICWVAMAIFRSPPRSGRAARICSSGGKDCRMLGAVAAMREETSADGTEDRHRAVLFGPPRRRTLRRRGEL